MDFINIIVGINLLLTFSANLAGAKKELKTTVIGGLKRPKTFLQKTPPNVAALILFLVILGVFGIGVLDEVAYEQYQNYRVIGAVFFIIFSWIQILCYKSLGKNYAQDIVIFKNHELKKDGFYRWIRHPQYLSQLLSDFGISVALMSFLAFPLVVLVELPLFIMRGNLEDKILNEHFKADFMAYKKKTGFFIPFIG